MRVFLGLSASPRIYHKEGCYYLNRILNPIESTPEEARKFGYCKCSYCGGLEGEIRANGKAIRGMEYDYNISTRLNEGVFYIRTDFGLWKVIEPDGDDVLQLYHANKFNYLLTDEEIMRSGFHKQKDVNDNKSLVKLIKYTVSHDKHKKLLYMGLVSNDKTPKKVNYYKKNKNEKWVAARRVEKLFEKLERENPEMKDLSVW